MNLSFYIFLRIESKAPKDHPVIQRIIKLKGYLDSLNPILKAIQPQINKLLTASESKMVSKRLKFRRYQTFEIQNKSTFHSGAETKD